MIAARLFSKTEDLPEGVSRPPLKTIKLNKAPVVLPTKPWAGEAIAARWGWDGEAQRSTLARYRARQFYEGPEVAAALAGTNTEIAAHLDAARAHRVHEIAHVELRADVLPGV